MKYTSNFICVYGSKQNSVQVFPETKHKRIIKKMLLAFMGRSLQNLFEIDGLDD